MLHLGPQFKLANRYAAQVAVFFVCMMFSLGIPILNFIGFLNFFFSYFVDKYLFITMYRSPPRYNVAISKSATRIIPWAVAVHIVFSIWALSNK